MTTISKNTALHPYSTPYFAVKLTIGRNYNYKNQLTRKLNTSNEGKERVKLTDYCRFVRKKVKKTYLAKRRLRLKTM